MSRRAIERRKAGSGFIENEIEIGTGKDDGFDAITLAEIGGYLTQSFLIPLRASAFCCKLHIDAMNFGDLVLAWLDDIDPVEHSEQLTVDCEFRTEKRNTAKLALRHLLSGDVQDIDERKGRTRHQLGTADVWRDGGDGGKGRSTLGQLVQKPSQIICQRVNAPFTNKRQRGRCVGVGNRDTREQLSGRTGGGDRLIIVDSCTNAEPTDQSEVCAVVQFYDSLNFRDGQMQTCCTLAVASGLSPL